MNVIAPPNLKQRDAEIVRRVMAGDLPLQLAEEFGISKSRVYWIISDARRAGVRVPDFTMGRPRSGQAPRASLRIRGSLSKAFGPDAERRNIDVATLCRLILNAVAEGRLVDAVLDDADDMEAAE